MAEAYGAKGERVEQLEDIQPAIRRALDSRRPCVLDVRVGDPQARHLNVTTRTS